MSSKKATPCSNYKNPLCILYGSATGNSEHIAKDLTKHIQSNISMLHPTFDHVICCELDQYKKVGCLQLWEQDLPEEEDTNTTKAVDDLQYQYRGVLIICSTTGNGDPPENAGRFVRHLKKAATAATHSTDTDTASVSALRIFRNVCYAVLGLGDTNYDQFCAAAVTIDRAIHQLGGHKCIMYDKKQSALTCADEGSGQLEDVVEPWIANIIPKIVQACQRPLPSVEENTPTTASISTSTDIATDSPGGDTTTAAITINPAENDKSDANGMVAVLEKEDDKTEVSFSNGVDEISSEPLSNGTTHSSTDLPNVETPVLESQVAIGVQMIQTMLSQQQHQEEQSDESSLVTDSEVDPSTLPASLLNGDENESTTATVSMKPFTYIAGAETETIDENEVYSDGNNNIQQRLRGLSIGSHNATMINNVVDDSVSSVSAGYYYTVQNPYHSQILDARYLTKTSTKAAQKVVTSIYTQQLEETVAPIDATDEKYISPLLYKEAEVIFDNAFPLTSTSPPSTTNPDASMIVQNGKRVIEMTLSLPDDATLEYLPGDSLGVIVDNPASIVEYVAKLLQQNDPSIHDPYQQMIHINYDYLTHQRSTTKPISVVDALSRHLDLSSAIKNKRILLSLSQLATDLLERMYLQLLSSKTNHGETLFRCIIDEQRMNIVDVLQLFPSTQSNITLEVLFQLVPNNIPPRYYSVSSSPLQPLHISNMNNGNSKHTNYLTIAFSVVDYVTPSMAMNSVTDLGQRRVRGVATRYLEAISSSLLCHNTVTGGTKQLMDDDNLQKQLQSITIPKLRIFPKPTVDFRMPHALSTPLILIGPGTGIAPFIGFLRHRQALLRQQSNAISINGDTNDSDGVYSTTTAAKTVVEGTWRGGYELENDNELAISQQDESGLNVGADFRLQSNHTLDYGSVDVLFGCRYENHDWLYKDEMNAFLQEGVITKLYTAFSRDEPADMNNRRYVQDIILNDVECGKRLIDLIVNHDAAVYVCGDGNSMAQDVQSAIITLLTSTQFQDNRELGKAYFDEMKRKLRFLMDIWS